jgi:SAM-dependent methyltransferase
VQPHAQRRVYDRVWTIGHVWNPRVWPEYGLIAPLLADCPHRLEIGPGTRPRLPITVPLSPSLNSERGQGVRSWFVDVSPIALGKLQAGGGNAVLSTADELPFPDNLFHVVAICELLEHIEADERAVAELARVTHAGGYLVLSVPLHPALWTAHDELAGHFRRYEPVTLVQLLNSNGYDILGFLPQPVGGNQYSMFKRIGAWLLARAPNLAIWLEDRVTLPIGVRLRRSVQRMLRTLPPDTRAPGGSLLCQRRPIAP